MFRCKQNNPDQPVRRWAVVGNARWRAKLPTYQLAILAIKDIGDRCRARRSNTKPAYSTQRAFLLLLPDVAR
jgi:hypothetical protein